MIGVVEPLPLDPDKLVRFATAYDLDVGRNVDEVLCALEGLQTGHLVERLGKRVRLFALRSVKDCPR